MRTERPDRIYRFDAVTDSTSVRLRNDVLRAEGAFYAVYAADRQTAGRGRAGRAFFSPEGGIYFSASFPFERSEPGLPWITLLAGLCAAEALSPWLGDNARVKWPNDLMVGDKKICGVLAQTVWRGDRPTVVLGVGVNTALSSSQLPEELAGLVTSFAMEGLALPDREAVIRRTVSFLDREIYENGALSGDLPGFVPKIREKDWLFGRRVARKLANGETLVGTAAGISDAGGLLLDTGTGKPVEITYGEVTPAL